MNENRPIFLAEKIRSGILIAAAQSLSINSREHRRQDKLSDSCACEIAIFGPIYAL